MTDQEEQDDELLALSSIYDNILKVTKEGELNGGELLAYPQLPDSCQAKFLKKVKPTENVEKAGSVLPHFESELHSITYLPPVALNFLLPTDYPSHNPPQFTLSCKWLNRKQLTVLCRKLDSIWEENVGSVVLFLWNSFLQEEILDILCLSSPLDFTKSIQPRKDSKFELDARAIQEVSCQDQLLAVILDFNKQEKLRKFEKSSNTCKVCFSNKAGSQCIMFNDCGHVYCKDCMRDFFVVRIQEGNVKGLECPDDKCESEANPSQVKELVSPEVYARYDRLLLQISLDMMSDITYCPRPICQSPVLLDRDESMASCPECRFSFCILCNFAYHGLSPCRLKAEGLVKLKEEYMNADDATKKFLEKKFGKIAIKTALEECFTNEWLKKFSKQCPGCGFNIQKIDGCNKMTCMKCRAYFCWLCNDLLSRANPYSHYNSEDSNCFHLLFDGAVEQNEWGNDEFFDDDDDDEWWEGL